MAKVVLAEDNSATAAADKSSSSLNFEQPPVHEQKQHYYASAFASKENGMQADATSARKEKQEFHDKDEEIENKMAEVKLSSTEMKLKENLEEIQKLQPVSEIVDHDHDHPVGSPTAPEEQKNDVIKSHEKEDIIEISEETLNVVTADVSKDNVTAEDDDPSAPSDIIQAACKREQVEVTLVMIEPHRIERLPEGENVDKIIPPKVSDIIDVDQEEKVLESGGHLELGKLIVGQEEQEVVQDASRRPEVHELLSSEKQPVVDSSSLTKVPELVRVQDHEDKVLENNRHPQVELHVVGDKDADKSDAELELDRPSREHILEDSPSEVELVVGQEQFLVKEDSHPEELESEPQEQIQDKSPVLLEAIEKEQIQDKSPLEPEAVDQEQIQDKSPSLEDEAVDQEKIADKSLTEVVFALDQKQIKDNSEHADEEQFICKELVPNNNGPDLVKAELVDDQEQIKDKGHPVEELVVHQEERALDNVQSEVEFIGKEQAQDSNSPEVQEELVGKKQVHDGDNSQSSEEVVEIYVHEEDVECNGRNVSEMAVDTVPIPEAELGGDQKQVLDKHGVPEENDQDSEKRDSSRENVEDSGQELDETQENVPEATKDDDDNDDDEASDDTKGNVPEERTETVVLKEDIGSDIAIGSTSVTSPTRDGDHDSGVDESTQRKEESPTKSQDVVVGKSVMSESKLKKPAAAQGKSSPAAKKSIVSPTTASPARSLKSSSVASSSKASTPTPVPEKKVPMNKVVVGTSAAPNIKVAKSKVGSLQNVKHKAGGGEVKLETKKIDLSTVKSKVGSTDNIGHKPLGGEKKVMTRKLEWKAESKVGSLDNAAHKAGGGDKKIETQKLDFKDKAKPKVGSKDNIEHKAGGGAVRIEERKLKFKETAKPKIGSLDNVTHKPGGGTVQIFDEKDYYRQQSSSSNRSLTGSDGRASPENQLRSPQPSPNSVTSPDLMSDGLIHGQRSAPTNGQPTQ